MNDTKSPFEIGTILESRYRIDAEVGRGGMGVVYRGTDLTLSRPVAIKAMLSNQAEAGLLARFMHEARSLASVEHRRLVPVYAVGQEKSVYYMVMRFVEGRPLSDVLAERGQLDESAVRRMLREVCEALSALHSAGLIHRDIKPANLMVEPDGSYTVMDLGIAKDAQDGAALMTSPMAGTPKYMPPEMFSDAPIDGRADLYALGIVAYHALTGMPPFDGPTPMAILYKQAHEDPTPIRQVRQDISKEMAQIIHIMMEKQPLHRYADAETALAAFSEDTETLGGNQSSKGGVFAVIGLALIGGIYLLSRPESKTSTATANHTSEAVTAAQPVPNSALSTQDNPQQKTDDKPELFKRRVQTNPKEVDVFQEGKKVGTTPYEITGRVSDPPIQLELRATAYESRTITVNFSGHGTDIVELKPVVATPKVTPKRKPSRKFELVPE